MEKKDFSKFLMDIYCHSSLNLAISLGHDLGLFKVFYATEEPLSLQDIASKTNLKERYTREWLSTMTAAEILYQDRATSLYTMPETHKEELKINAAYSSFIILMAKRINSVKNCFHRDGPQGFGYDVDGAFFDLCQDIHHKFDIDLNSTVIPLLEQQEVGSKLRSGINALDVGCGSADKTAVLAMHFDNTQFTGLENDEYGSKIAQKTAENISNLTIVKGDAENLPNEWTGQFEWVFMHDVLHDLPNPHKVLNEIYKVLKDDGSFCLIDFGFHSDPQDNVGNMTAAMFFSLSRFICLPASMEKEPHVGFGQCWGKEEIEKALVGAKFKVSKVNREHKVFFFCKKIIFTR